MTSQLNSVATPLDVAATASLRRRFGDAALTARDAGYDDARAHWNSRVDAYPAAIIRCRSTQDVADAVLFARELDLAIAVRSGGHNSVGLALCDGGLVIDLSQMKQIEIDPMRQVARAQPGATLGEFVPAALAHGLATTTGTCAGVGLGGSTLGGGIGWLGGKHGLTIDNVRAFELVTADGAIHTASAASEPELFWALRGGGGNFGIVTTIEYQLHQIDMVLGGMIIFPLAHARTALAAYRDMSERAPDPLVAHAILATLPEIGPALIVQACYSGDDLAEGERVLAPLRNCAPPIVDMIRPMHYGELFGMLTPPVHAGYSYHETAYSLRTMSDAAIDTMVSSYSAATSPFNLIIIHQVRGAATNGAPDATAFALREPHFPVINVGCWAGGTGEEHVHWAEEALAAMAGLTSRGLYVNFMGFEGETAVREAYRANYARLSAIKRAYDPENVFRRNQNIVPAP